VQRTGPCCRRKTTAPGYFGGVVVVVVEFVVVVGGVVGAVALEPSGAVVVVVPGVPGVAVADESAGGVAVGADASVEVDEVVVEVDAASSAFFWQAPSARLEAASTAAVAIRLVRQVGDVMEWLPREKSR
jgi:hypothetical protein